ncbi:MAB_1171c family putative transporter [Longispora sp. NPDC051575]|uniref:MAB_1171c family putative transporter n=1 Tax=Longispora sp. NPDC051575 TaxID=3154943 RepID=UPI0034177BFF
MIVAVPYVAFVVSLLASGYKLVRGGGVAGLRYLCGAIVCSGAAAAVLAPNTVVLTTRYEVVPHTSLMVGNGLIMGASLCLALLSRTVQHSRRAGSRQPLVPLLAFLVSYTVMIVLVYSETTESTTHFSDLYGDRPAIAIATVICLSYIGWGMSTFFLLIGHYLRHAEEPVLRFGLRVVASGTLFGLAWVAWTAARAVGRMLQYHPHIEHPPPVSTLLGAMAVLLWALGATLSAWGSTLVRPYRWLRALHGYRALGPLWSALHAEFPEIALERSTSRLPWDAGFALYRRVIEIRDAHLALRGYFHPDVSAWVRGQDPTVAEAARVAAALVAHAAGHRYLASPAPPHEVGPTVESEAAWLIGVTRAFTDSRTVADIRRRVQAELGVTAAPATR